jgi:16S rRNA (adenine(1408)-N(1))-methyltransferase
LNFLEKGQEMEIICGKRTGSLDAAALQAKLSGFREILLDLGTGDGRFVTQQVGRHIDLFGIGIDACRENLRIVSRREDSRTLFVIANALDLPPDLAGLVSWLTVNFPWGSLLNGLLTGDPAVYKGFARTSAKGARLEVRLNESAVHEADWDLAEAGEKIRSELERVGYLVDKRETFDKEQLKTFPTTWAHKMAFGRAPRGILLRGEYR